jgi:hypothetical protein
MKVRIISAAANVTKKSVLVRGELQVQRWRWPSLWSVSHLRTFPLVLKKYFFSYRITFC